jgi:hypothetical protein
MLRRQGYYYPVGTPQFVDVASINFIRLVVVSVLGALKIIGQGFSMPATDVTRNLTFIIMIIIMMIMPSRRSLQSLRRAKRSNNDALANFAMLLNLTSSLTEFIDVLAWRHCTQCRWPTISCLKTMAAARLQR